MHRVLHVKGVEVEGGEGESVDADFHTLDVQYAMHLEGVEVEGGEGESVDADFAGNDVGLLHLDD